MRSEQSAAVHFGKELMVFGILRNITSSRSHNPCCVNNLLLSELHFDITVGLGMIV